MEEALAGPAADDVTEEALGTEHRMVGQAKKLALFAAGCATQKYLQNLQDEQEILGAIADMVIEVYAMESAVLRTQKLLERQSAATLPLAMTRLYVSRALEKIQSAATKILTASAEGDTLRTQLAILRRFAKHEPFNCVGLARVISEAIIERGKYAIA